MQTGGKIVMFQGNYLKCNEKVLQDKLIKWGFTYDPMSNYVVWIHLTDDKKVRVIVGTSIGSHQAKRLIAKDYARSVDEIVNKWVVK